MEVVSKSIPATFSVAALGELKRLYALQGGEKCLRLGAKGGGCSGLNYVLEFDEHQAEDTIYELDGMPVAIDPAHLVYIKNISIDWSSGLNARGFTFTNPNATKTCGCGTSFAI